VDGEDRALKEEGKRTMDEWLLTVVRDGSEHPVSELLSQVEAVPLSYTGVSALPARLYDTRRQKFELTNTINRLKKAGVLQVQGTGAQRRVKLTNPPDWLMRARQRLDEAEAQASRELLKRLSDEKWHPADTLLSWLQHLQFPGVSEIGKFAVAYGALEAALREGRCERQTSGEKGKYGHTEDIKLAGPGLAPDTGRVAPAEGTPRPADGGSTAGEETSSSGGEGVKTRDARGSTPQGDRTGVPETDASGAEGVGEPESASRGIPSQPSDGAATSPQDSQPGPETPTGDVAGGESTGEPGVSNAAVEATGEQAAILRLDAGFRPEGATAEIAYIDSDKIDLDDDEDHPVREVPGLSQSVDTLGYLQLPAVRPGPVEGRFRAVFGRSRLREGKKRGGKVPCIVLRGDERTADLATIDENLVRSELTVLERAEYLRRRKQIYEELNPEAARPQGGRPQKNRATVARFSEDAAQRTGSSRRQVQLDIEIADKLAEPTKKVLRPTAFADQTTVLAKLAKLEPRDQLAAAKVLVKGQATTVKEATRILEERRQAKVGAGEAAEPNTSALAATPEGGVGRPSFEILTGDCLSLLPAQAAGRFRLVVADPPQNDGTDYGEGTAADQLPEAEYLAWVKRWLEACVPLLTDDGSLWFLTRDQYVQAVRDLLTRVGLHPQSWVKVYEPPGVSTPRGFRASTLHLLHFTKAADQFLFHADGLEQDVTRSPAEARALTALGCKLSDDVWVIPRLKAADRERIPAFPVQRRKALLQPIVRCATDQGDWVLDPFSGSATAGVVALEDGRNYVGIERSAEFADLSRGRLAAAPGVQVEES
jgi:DNA modification methylase/ParB-like chromosome segregation protein Spo0J